MTAYIIRRILLMIPTLFGIMVINFLIVQLAPGGPIEEIIARLHGTDAGATARFGGSATSDVGGAPGAMMHDATEAGGSHYPGAAGVDPELIKQLERQFGFDEPLYLRFFKMIGNYLRFDFGKSYFRDETVFHSVVVRLPVSVSLGIWSSLLIYLISIPLGIRKAVKDGTPFDVWSSAIVIAGNAIPSYLFAVLLIVLFAGSRYFDWFPLRGLVSDNWQQMNLFHKVGDYFWHMALPICAMVIGGFASLTMLTKNSFLDEINKQYVLTARAKGLSERRVLYGHVFRNAMLIVIAGLPSAFISILFTTALLIEVIFSLDGIGLLGFTSIVNRDYPGHLRHALHVYSFGACYKSHR